MNSSYKIYIVGICLTFLLISCNTQKPGKETGSINDFTSLSSLFKNPSKEYKTAPFYVWNTLITREKIDSTLQELKDAGFGGVFVHPRYGLVTEYVSDDWYNLFRYAVDKGKSLDMNVWIYDENSYPSGFAGGHVPAEMPESYNQGQGLIMQHFEILPDTASKYYLCLKEQNGQYVDIRDKLQVESGKKGHYYLFSKSYADKSSWYGGFSYVDLLYPGVTQKFIEVTMNGYEKVASDEFGKAVPGIFTDEPNINSPGGIRWTPDLFQVFQEKWGYDLKVNLPSLYEETGNWKTIRHNYSQTLLQLFVDRWAKPYHDYCATNNLKFTGHYWEHGWPDVGHGGDNMAMYAWHQLPAIDMLFNQFNEESPQAQFGNVRAVKELRSVANQLGYTRTLSETYGGGGWEETFRDFKRLGDWEYVLGVNFMNQHLTHLSISGARKYDYPPVFSKHSPWWPYYKTLNDYFARMSVTMSAGNQLNNILILEPTSSLWLYYSYTQSDSVLWEIGNKFQSFVTNLEKAQIEYDLGSENIIKDQGKIVKASFEIGNRAYSKVVIPPMTENLDKPTFKLLKQFAENGGSILAFSNPVMLDGKPDDELKTFFAKNNHIVHLTELTPETVKQHFVSSDLVFTQSGGNLFHHRRMMNDGQLLFLVNSSLAGTSKGSFTINGKDAVEMNAFTGEITDYSETDNGKQININFDIPPAGSLLLYVFNKKQQDFTPPEKTMHWSIINAASPVAANPVGNNVLTLDFCDLQLGRETFKDQHVYDAADKVFKYHGFINGNPWNTSVQYKNSIVSRDTFKTGGFKASYKFIIKGEFDRSTIHAVVEKPQLYKITINGKLITPEPGQWWLDREFGVFNIGQYVKQGENTLSYELAPMKIQAEIEPVYILGNFTLQSSVKGWTINKPNARFSMGSWKKNGWPFFAGAVTYTKTYSIDEVSEPYKVKLNQWNGTVAEVRVNGTSAGIIYSDPYTLDVSKLIRKGENKIDVIIIGSNKNLLGPFHNDPSPGLVSPWHFRNVKEYPSGDVYQQLDYGLMEDFELLQGNERR